MYTVEVREGRLLEIRMESPLEFADVQEFRQRVMALVGAALRPVIACTDLRRARIFSPDSAEAITSMMRHDNPRVERNAILVGDSALFSMQVERMVREAGSHSRRTFREPLELKLWLRDALSESERWRLNMFVTESPRGDRPHY
jgi:hypothetical protein